MAGATDFLLLHLASATLAGVEVTMGARGWQEAGWQPLEGVGLLRCGAQAVEQGQAQALHLAHLGLGARELVGSQRHRAS